MSTKLKLIKQKYALILGLLNLLFFTTNVFSQNLAQVSSPKDTLSVFQASIETDYQSAQQVYYKVTLSCRSQKKVSSEENDYIFLEKYRFALYMLEDILELIGEAEKKCRCGKP
ncbi:MAG: hypothetical protein NW226_04920 [Microscillaceae bacterium]|nr:hypothetical protein [Microscillaceae bacterium]